MSLETVQEVVVLPKAADALAKGVSALVFDIFQAHKAGGGVAGEVIVDLTSAVKELGPALTQIGALGEEGKLDVIGVCEAFALAGFELARKFEKNK